MGRRGLQEDGLVAVLIRRGIVPQPGYTGPGDVVGGASAWWGLRAYSSAKAGTNCCDIIRASDSATQTFTTLANGNLDTASITTFLTATTGKITKLYDQTGNGNDATQGTDASRPAITLAAIGSLAVLTFSGAQALQAATGNPGGSGFTLTAVGKRVTGTGFQDLIGDQSGTNNSPQLGFKNAADTSMQFAGIVGEILSTVATDNQYHAMVGQYGGASAVLYCDGSSSAGAQSAVGGNTPLTIGNGNNALNGTWTEAGWWASSFNSTQATAMISNARTYWRF